MRELKDLARWYGSLPNGHVPTAAETLPDPSFRCDGRRFVSFSTNNYLGLATSRRLKERAHAALEQYGVGNCESRLLGGNLEIYDRLEARLAEIKKKESALLFATGFLANLGVLPALVRMGRMARAVGYIPRTAWRHTFFTDEFNHLSIREGIRASGVPAVAFKHRDMNDLESKLKNSTASIRIIVSDGVFSQHGDIVPLPDMLQLAERYDAIVYIDDAHGTGVLGETGAGTTEYFGVDSPRLINMGTLSKAYGCIGGFVATDAYLTDMLRIGCPPFGFTSTLPPDQAAAVLEAIDMVRDEPERRRRLWDNQRYLVCRMREVGLSFESTDTPILPLRVSDEARCVRVASALLADGLHVDAITYPGIPLGQSRLRFIVNANHDVADMDRLVELLGHHIAAEHSLAR